MNKNKILIQLCRAVSTSMPTGRMISASSSFEIIILINLCSWDIYHVLACLMTYCWHCRRTPMEIYQVAEQRAPYSPNRGFKCFFLQLQGVILGASTTRGLLPFTVFICLCGRERKAKSWRKISSSHAPRQREKQKVIMGQLEEIKRETTYCMRHFISVSYKFKRQ